MKQEYIISPLLFGVECRMWVCVSFSRIPTSPEVGLDVAAYNELLQVLHTHFMRSGYVML